MADRNDRETTTHRFKINQCNSLAEMLSENFQVWSSTEQISIIKCSNCYANGDTLIITVTWPPSFPFVAPFVHVVNITKGKQWSLRITEEWSPAIDLRTTVSGYLDVIF